MGRIRSCLPVSDDTDKQKGKRSTVDISPAPILLSKRSRLDTIGESIEDNQFQQNEIRNLFANDVRNSVLDANPTEFLGLQFGNLPERVSNLREPNILPAALFSSLFTAVNPENVMNPHRVEITRIAEVLPMGGAGMSGVTRFHPYPNMYLGGRSGGSRRSLSNNEDRQGFMDFSSLDVNAGAREEQPQIEEETQNVESVSESDTPPCGPTA